MFLVQSSVLERQLKLELEFCSPEFESFVKWKCADLDLLTITYIWPTIWIREGIKTVVMHLSASKPFVFKHGEMKSLKQLPLMLYFNCFCQ
jgi:hypothetical protein